MSDDLEPTPSGGGFGPAPDGDEAFAPRAMCRKCYGSGERRIQRAAVIGSPEYLGGTAVVPEMCVYCDGEGWLEL